MSGYIQYIGIAYNSLPLSEQLPASQISSCTATARDHVSATVERTTHLPMSVKDRLGNTPYVFTMHATMSGARQATIKEHLTQEGNLCSQMAKTNLREEGGTGSGKNFRVIHFGQVELGAPKVFARAGGRDRPTARPKVGTNVEGEKRSEIGRTACFLIACQKFGVDSFRHSQLNLVSS